MLLYIIRHGDPDYTTDTLTEKGKVQAELVGKRLFEAGIDRVFSSPLGRARETAEPLCRMLGVDYTVEEWTREIETETMYTRVPDGVQRTISNIQNTLFLGDGGIGLGYEDAFDAVGFRDTRMREIVMQLTESGDEFLERLGYKKENGIYRILRENEEKVALFCHGAMGRAWIASLLHIPLHMMWAHFNYSHTGVTILEFRNNANGITAPKCLSYCDLSHIYASGAENMIYNNKTRI